MKTTSNLFARVSAWLTKPLMVFGVVIGLGMATAPAANAQAWNFSYTTAGINVVGQINAVWNVTYGVWSITSVSGTRDGNAITGLWEQTPGSPANQNYIAGPSYNSAVPYFWDQMDLHYLVGASQYAFGWIVGYSGPAGGPYPNTEGPLSNLDWAPPTIINGTGRCIVGQGGCAEATDVQIAQVPEINASAGLEALALLFLFGFMMREMFLRRRGNASLSA